MESSSLGRLLHVAFCAAVFVFLIAPILVDRSPELQCGAVFHLYRRHAAGSTRMPGRCAGTKRGGQRTGSGCRALVNSLVIGVSATDSGHRASACWRRWGWRARRCRAGRVAMSLLISPMVTPVIVSAAGMFFFYSSVGLAQTHLGLDTGPCGAWNTLRRHHGDRDPGRFQPRPDAGGGEPRGRALGGFPPRAATAGPSRNAFPVPCSPSRPRSTKW